ncbi:hypothetical protein NBRC116494_06360 [Aurantivibrio plasticivorans]
MPYIKPSKSKAKERQELTEQIDAFLKRGGHVTPVERGISGKEIGAYQIPPVTFSEPKENRTPLVNEVKAIDARRKPTPTPKKVRKQPRRVLIRDDFGEPLRWSWED